MAASTLRDYVAALEAQGKTDETILKLEQMLKGVPAFLNDGTRDASGWMYQKLIEKLIAAKRPDEAASWARLHFMECAFDAAVLDRAAKLVAQAMLVQDPSRKSFGAFVAAQKDPTQPNTLSAVALPKVEEEKLAQLWEGVNKEMAWQQYAQAQRERVSLLILGGQTRQAVQEANTLLWARRAGAPEPKPDEKPVATAEGIVEVARALKAHDLNLQRANAFLAYMKSGQGENPLAAFLAETPAAGSIKVTP